MARIQRRQLGRRIAWLEVDADDAPVSIWDTIDDALAGLPTPIPAAGWEHARVLAPVTPSKIVCVGLNYHAHAREMGRELPEEPLIFLKPSTALLDPGMSIELPPSSQNVHHEGELAIVISKRCSRVRAEDALNYVAGYTIMNDVTARDIQKREGRYTRAKGFDTFAPLGPTLVTDLDPDAVSIEVRVNGELRQQSSCSDLIFPIPALIAFISEAMTLLPGDVISTGTPSGVGPISDGDTVDVSITSIGRLSNPVSASA